MNTPVRLTARIATDGPGPKASHYRGLPPELTGGKDQRERMPRPALVTIEQKPDGVFLFRFTSNGLAVGDTWHMTVEEAQDQARFEFGDSLLEWKAVPADVDDLVSFGLNAED